MRNARAEGKPCGLAEQIADLEALRAHLGFETMYLLGNSWDRDAFLARAKDFRYSQSVNRAVWTDLQRFDLDPEPGKFRFPSLVITGRYDFNVAPSAFVARLAAFLAQRISRAARSTR